MSSLRPAFFLMTLALAVPLAANDTEIGLSLGAATPRRSNLSLEVGRSVDLILIETSIAAQFSGPWKLVGLDLAHEVFRTEKMKVWVRGGYTKALGSPDYQKFGFEYSSGVLSNVYKSETIEGTLDYSNYTMGAGLSWVTNKVGEYGLSLDRRTHRIRINGNQSQFSIFQGVPGTDQNSTMAYSHSTTSSDFLLTFSMSFVQTHRTFKTYQRISYGIALGGPSGDVVADRQGWVMSNAYLERTNPSQELRFGYGFRL